ncbi:uncharacterized protein EI90DRAFT_2908845 [Cantharellus anzutake]|uniref:uncharacterized protein n=1 Tax=Cantharellus anzutake TaxID=1750568 RepID=UPI0019041470|nr:uncharacterized protein EI90DRAFT_2908845 [Cantharellus anzutake]KAF8338002.1 hypothetical protein EI90DRAFT_2908845 [Cantharellus anzutake]
MSSFLRLRIPVHAAFSAARSAAIARPAIRALPLAFARRAYSASSLSREDIEKRVLNVIQSFEKVQPEKLTTSASFDKDLGFDSLDAVEVVMAEFSIEIPDEEADQIKSVQQAIDYIARTPAGECLHRAPPADAHSMLPQPTKV